MARQLSRDVHEGSAGALDPFQHEFLNSGNQIADELAKSLARASLNRPLMMGFYKSGTLF